MAVVIVKGDSEFALRSLSSRVKGSLVIRVAHTVFTVVCTSAQRRIGDSFASAQAASLTRSMESASASIAS